MKLPFRWPTTRARAIAVALVALLLFSIGFVPLFDGPGYELSIASGVVLPTVAAIVAALEGYRDPRHVAARTPLVIVGRGLGTAAILSGVALCTSFVHVARVGACDPFSGVLTFALTAFLGALLGGACGAVAAIATAHLLAETRRRRRYAIALAVMAPLSTALVALSLFYLTPAVFAFDPFVGFFSGTLYDEVVDAYRPLLTYRAGTLLTLSAMATAAAALDRDDHGRLRITRKFVLGIAIALSLGSATLIAFGGALHHRTSATAIEEALGGHLRGPRCDVWFPRTTPDDEAGLILRDCEEELAAVEHRLGAHGPPRVTAFFFKDANDKRVLMGAAETYVAKPWRREVYLQVASYPHPVLGHELAHVVAGSFGRGPFAIAGQLGGLLPNPGLIEGVAVAASPDRDELTPAQWAHAMKSLELLPHLSSIFGRGFFATNSSTAYTVAGAFIGWLIDTGRGDAVRAWYAGASFDRAFGQSFADTENSWRDSLDAVELPPAALAVAKARFDRPGIWGRRCPHVVERLRDDAEECRGAGDLDAAESKLNELLRLDVGDPNARMSRAKIAGERGDFEGYQRQLRAIIDDPRVSTTHRGRAREALGDEALREGRLDEARTLYDETRKEVIDDDWARTLDVKSWIAETPARAAIFARMLVRPLRGHDETTAAIIALAEHVVDPRAPHAEVALSRYLLARRLVDAKTYDDADALLVPLLDDPSLDEISTRIRRETARLHVLIACLSPMEGRKSLVESALRAYASAPPGNAGRKEFVSRLAERCVGER